MGGARGGVLLGIAENQQRHRFEIGGKIEGLRHPAGIPVHHPDRADAEVGSFQHHVGRHNAGVDLTAPLPVKGPLPARLPVMADKKRLVKMQIAAGNFLQSLFLHLAADDQDPLGLKL